MIAYSASEIDLLLREATDTMDLFRIANYLNWHKRSYTQRQLTGWQKLIIELIGVFEQTAF